jgi:hypothetical protein
MAVTTNACRSMRLIFVIYPRPSLCPQYFRSRMPNAAFIFVSTRLHIRRPKQLVAGPNPAGYPKDVTLFARVAKYLTGPSQDSGKSGECSSA